MNYAHGPLCTGVQTEDSGHEPAPGHIQNEPCAGHGFIVSPVGNHKGQLVHDSAPQQLVFGESQLHIGQDDFTAQTGRTLAVHGPEQIAALAASGAGVSEIAFGQQPIMQVRQVFKIPAIDWNAGFITD